MGYNSLGMNPQVFYRRWRPQTLSDVVGQEQVTRILLNALKNRRVAHAYLFCGPRGTGKTSTGRIMAKAVNCFTTGGLDEPCNTCSMCRSISESRALDVIEIDAASNTGVENIRDLRERANYTPSEARYKVYIIDEVHMLSSSASNALLKTLEEPPPHVIFILATTEVHKVIPTVLSRCQHFDFRRIAQVDVVARLEKICDSEGVKIGSDTLRLIARSATGSLRDAENILEQLITHYGDEIKLEDAQNTLGISGQQRIKEMIGYILNIDIAGGIKTINDIGSKGMDLRQFNRELLDYLRAMLLLKTGANDVIDLPDEDIVDLKSMVTDSSVEQILNAVRIFGQLAHSGSDSYSTLPLELAMVDCVTGSKLLTGIEAEPVGRMSSEQVAKSPHPLNKPVAEKRQLSQVESSGTTAKNAKGPATEPVLAYDTSKEEIKTPVDRPESGGEAEFLRQNWKRIIESAPAETQRTAAIAFLRSSSKPVSFEDNTVVLSFRFSIHKDNMEKPQNLTVAEKIISNAMGYPCRVRCVYQHEQNNLVEAAIKMGAEIIDVEDK